MKKAKYISNYHITLTKGKIYDVIDKRINYNESILITNDLGRDKWYIIHSYSNGEFLFEDATAEHRNGIIDGILK